MIPAIFMGVQDWLGFLFSSFFFFSLDSGFDMAFGGIEEFPALWGQHISI